MRKWKWNCKKFFRNVLYLLLYLIYIAFIYEVFANIDKNPTCQYHSYLENGGSWQEWASSFGK